MADLSSLKSLLASVQKADGPDREIDREIGFVLAGWQLKAVTAYTEGPAIVTADGDVYVDHPGGMYPSFTESIDEAVALVEKVRGEEGEWSVAGLGNAFIYGKHPQASAIAKATPSLALIAALLSTLIIANEGYPNAV